MKKKVLLVITKSNWGGAQRYVYNLATALSEGANSEFIVSVACGGTGEAGSDVGELAARLKSARIQTFYIPAFARDVSFFSDIQAVRELYILFKKEKPDIVHLNSSKAGGVGALAARLAGIKKIIFTSHGLAWDEDRNALTKSFIYVFSRLTFLLCTKIITISHDNYERARACWLCKNKIYLIHNGLPSLQFETRERARISLALKVGLVEDGNAFWIGTVAELTKNKGLSYLIDAAKILKHKGSQDTDNNFHLFIIGSGEEEQSLKKQIIENNLEDSVHLVGFVSDAYRYDKAFDIFILTSIKEGLPTVLLEAGQAGVSVVATNIPGNRDIIEDNKTGLLAESKNAQDIAEKIEELMRNIELRKTLVENLEQKVTKEFSIEKMIEKTKQLYI
jgi:glycosyltransferase involved in cell wall biosynthesis